MAEEGEGAGRPGSTELLTLGTCEWTFGWCIGERLRRGRL